MTKLRQFTSEENPSVDVDVDVGELAAALVGIHRDTDDVDAVMRDDSAVPVFGVVLHVPVVQEVGVHGLQGQAAQDSQGPEGGHGAEGEEGGPRGVGRGGGLFPAVEVGRRLWGNTDRCGIGTGCWYSDSWIDLSKL